MIIDELEKKVQGKGVRIVFTEGWDPRVQKAAIDLKNNVNFACIFHCKVLH